MVGTIFGLGLAHQFDASGEPISGAKLYLYEAGTSTPVTAYEDFGLTTGLELPWPIVTDAAGRLPAFWLADGSYRVRLTDSDGNEIFDESSITAIGASSGAASGGGTSTESVLKTGDCVFSFDTSSRDGFVRLNGKSIGSSSSGATERANSDTEALFTHIWNKVSDTYAAVAGGRGASAAADWSANKRINLPDARGKALYGLDDMGATAAGVLTGVTDAGETGGDEETTIAEANLPSHTHGAGSLAVDSHTHDAGTYAVGSHTHGAGSYTTPAYVLANVEPAGVGGDNSLDDLDVQQSGTDAISGTSGSTAPTFSGSSGAAAPGITGVSGATGSGTAATTVSPYCAGTWYIKL
jgi:hypothetical protein